MKCKILLPLLFCFFIAGCDLWLNVGGASGELEDNYIEEPLDGQFSKYSSQLNSSNSAMKLIQTMKPDMVYENLFGSELKSKLSASEFSANIFRFLSKAGEMSEYKEMQWAFFPKSQGEQDILRSIKIGKHGDKYIAYVFIYSERDDFTKIAQFQVIPLDGKSP